VCFRQLASRPTRSSIIKLILSFGRCCFIPIKKKMIFILKWQLPSRGRQQLGNGSITATWQNAGGSGGGSLPEALGSGPLRASHRRLRGKSESATKTVRGTCVASDDVSDVQASLPADRTLPCHVKTKRSQKNPVARVGQIKKPGAYFPRHQHSRPQSAEKGWVGGRLREGAQKEAVMSRRRTQNERNFEQVSKISIKCFVSKAT
jgi:hypothetical protein